MGFLEVLKKRRRRFVRSLFLAILVSLLASLASSLGYFEGLETGALDLLFRLRGQTRSPEIVLVRIDDQAFRRLGERQPLPRSYLADLIDVLAASGARVIALDVELKVKTDPRADAALVQAVRKASNNGVSKVVAIYLIHPEKRDGETVRYSRAPFFSPELRALAGFADAPVDPDGFVRRVPLAVRGADGRVLPSLALAVLARYAGYDSSRLERALNAGGKEITLRLPQWDRFRGRLLPRPTPLVFRLDDDWKINFAGGRESFISIPSDPVAALAKLHLRPAADNPFRGKIVLVGASFGDSRDFFPTPRGLMSGMEIHANIIHTLLSRSQILPARRIVGLFLSLGFAFLVGVLLSLFRPALVTVVSLLAVPLLLIPLSYLALARLGVWVDFTTPMLAVWLGGLAVDLRERRHIRKALGQFVDREAAGRIVEQEGDPGGEKKVVTVCFTDVRDYTTLCEESAPEKVVDTLNELFGVVARVVSRHRGLVSDFIGDAVMAVFGAAERDAEHARNAVRAAVELQEELARLNEEWKRRGGRPIHVGVGIHTGEAMAGVVGSEGRKKFTFTGDTVNTASRVEGLNRDFSTGVLITRETLESGGERFPVRPRGAVRLKGRARPVEVFEVLGFETG